MACCSDGDMLHLTSVIDDKNVKILVTGCAGFIGFHVVAKLLELGYQVIGTDCASVRTPTTLIKPYRLDYMTRNYTHNFEYKDANFEQMQALESIWDDAIGVVIHLGARAGVRESTTDPEPYIFSNCVGHFNVLDMCRRKHVKHLVYASSSSVYGNNSKIPFQEQESCDEPLSLYAATKKSTELMSYTYSYLYALPCTGLRFFTVYGPWGRPDMAVYSFADKIINQQPISLFNGGDNIRSFTYIDDVVEGVIAAMRKPCQHKIPYRILNVGTDRQNTTNELVELLELNLGRTAVKKFTQGIKCDMRETGASLAKTTSTIDYSPKVSLAQGIHNFVQWYKQFNHII